jgi:hypothetical protein
MQKTYFHNNKILNENEYKEKPLQTSNVFTKRVVDVNVLLNKVKIEKNNEKKKKIVITICTTLALSLFGIFIAIIK